MPRTNSLLASTLLSSLLALSAAQSSESSSPTPASTTQESGFSTTLNGTPTSFRSIFTIPASADVGVDVLPNIQDPSAVNAQDVCPGYKASNLKENDKGLTATLSLAGQPCNVYGIDVEELSLSVEYQAKGRLAVGIVPKYLDASNQSQWMIPEDLVPKPQAEDWEGDADIKFDCKF